jgi:hypothetical protein
MPDNNFQNQCIQNNGQYFNDLNSGNQFGELCCDPDGKITKNLIVTQPNGIYYYTVPKNPLTTSSPLPPDARWNTGTANSQFYCTSQYSLTR